MSTKKDLKFIRFVKRLLDFIFGALIVASVGLLIWIALMPLIVGRSGSLGTASVPVRIGVGDQPRFEVVFTAPTEDAIESAVVEEAEGTLRLETSTVWLIRIANSAKLLAGIGLAYIFYLLRAIVQSILDGQPFAVASGRRLRRLAYTVLIVGILRPLFEYIAAAEVLSRLPSSVPQLNPGPTFNSELLLATLLILLLAHIWSYGLELERERALTI